MPSFLTKEVGEKAIKAAFQMSFDNPEMAPLFDGREHMHAVILALSMEDARPDYPAYPNYPCTWKTLCEMSRGNKAEWKHPFDSIARCKALKLSHGRAFGGNDVQAHLLFPNDTRWCGGVSREGIVVACSGVQAYFDRMISGWIADACIAISYHDFQVYIKENPDADFIQ